jgi:hypothetical protein
LSCWQQIYQFFIFRAPSHSFGQIQRL